MEVYGQPHADAHYYSDVPSRSTGHPTCLHEKQETLQSHNNHKILQRVTDRFLYSSNIYGESIIKYSTVELENRKNTGVERTDTIHYVEHPRMSVYDKIVRIE